MRKLSSSKGGSARGSLYLLLPPRALAAFLAMVSKPRATASYHLGIVKDNASTSYMLLTCVANTRARNGPGPGLYSHFIRKSLTLLVSTARMRILESGLPFIVRRKAARI